MSWTRTLLLGALVFPLCGSGSAQTNANPKLIAIRASHMLDVKAGTTISNVVVLIEEDKIRAVGPSLTIPSSAEIVELGEATLLPGLIDCHTHLLARIPSGPDGYGLNLLTKSQAFRALEGAADARITLRAGFTSVRDVENEGSGYADVALRDAVNQGLVEGPRMQVATRAIAAIGQYNPFGISPDLRDFPRGAQMISGPEEARRAAREQIGFGADLLKVYADWGHPTLTIDEIRAVVEEAHKARLKVAAHADSLDGIRNALIAGVDSIEHGGFADRTSLELMKQKNAYWVPTKGDFFFRLDSVTNPRQRKYMEDVLNNARQNITLARELGVRIANGFDASSAEDQGHNGREIVAMCKLGLSPLEAIRAATTTATELMGWQDKVGSIAPGKFADIIAVPGDPLLDISQVEHVNFVMKGGVVIKNEVSRATAH